MPFVHTSASHYQVAAFIRELPGILSGRFPDPDGIAEGFRLRMAFAFFSAVKEAFIVKARGGTDEAGISWAKPTPAYLAYGRGPESTRRAGGLAPGKRKSGAQKDGFMSPSDLKQWKRTFAVIFHRLLAQLPEEEAAEQAARVAWAAAKRSGVKTKLAVFGGRDVETLRDRGTLFNSLSPGILSESGHRAGYTPPEGQSVEHRPHELAVGTNVPYAAYHQYGKGRRARPLWPPDGNLPDSWWLEIIGTARSGLMQLKGPA